MLLIDGGRMTKWYDIRKTLPPDDTWILVRNSAGYYAAVNDTAGNPITGQMQGWVITPEEEHMIIRGFDEWAFIE